MSCRAPLRASAGHRRPLGWLICLSLLVLSAGCAAPAPIRAPIEPPAAALAAPCWPGPEYPEGVDVPLGQLLEIVAQREIAAAECRARQAALVRAWPQ